MLSGLMSNCYQGWCQTVIRVGVNYIGFFSRLLVAHVDSFPVGSRVGFVHHPASGCGLDDSFDGEGSLFSLKPLLPDSGMDTGAGHPKLAGSFGNGIKLVV